MTRGNVEPSEPTLLAVSRPQACISVPQPVALVPLLPVVEARVGGGLKTRDGKPLSHFAVAGEDKNFVEATATIDGGTVVVRADGVAKPVAVRFGWHEEAEPNLSNKEGLPASPFRTDSW